jgi:hypothetical protein
VVCGIAAVSCLAAAVTAGLGATAEMTRQPTAGELNAAASTGVAQRWEREPAGAIFPGSIGYSTDLLTQETATRLGISPVVDCAASVDHTLLALAARYRCHAGVRAGYADQLQGVVYTIGVLAFPTAAAASAFAARLPRPTFPASGLHALALAGTAAARFGDAARQLAVARRAGPYVVLVVAGYSDGRAATATEERRDSAFASAGQLADAVATPLGLPETVDCRATGEWSC